MLLSTAEMNLASRVVFGSFSASISHTFNWVRGFLWDVRLFGVSLRGSPPPHLYRMLLFLFFSDYPNQVFHIYSVLRIGWHHNIQEPLQKPRKHE